MRLSAFDVKNLLRNPPLARRRSDLALTDSTSAYGHPRLSLISRGSRLDRLAVTN